MIDAKRIMSEETNNPKPPEDNVDLELAFAMSEAASVIEAYVKQQIGEPAFWAYKNRERDESGLSDLPEEMREDLIADSQHRFGIKAAEKGMDLLDKGYDAASAMAYGKIDALLDAIDSIDDSGEDEPYLEAWEEINEQFMTVFDLNAQGEFTLNSVDHDILNISLPATLDLRTEVVYRPVGMDIETRAQYLREVPSVNGPFAMELKRFAIDLKGDSPLGSIDVAQLQKDVLAVLKETVAELKQAA